MKLICAEKTTFSRRQKLRPPFNKRRTLLLERRAKRQHFVYVKIAVARCPLTAEPRTTRPLKTARKCIREQPKPHPTGPKKKIRSADSSSLGARPLFSLRPLTRPSRPLTCISGLAPRLDSSGREVRVDINAHLSASVSTSLLTKESKESVRVSLTVNIRMNTTFVNSWCLLLLVTYNTLSVILPSVQGKVIVQYVQHTACLYTHAAMHYIATL